MSLRVALHPPSDGRGPRRGLRARVPPSKQRWRRSTPAYGTRRQRPMTRAVAEQGVSPFSCRSAGALGLLFLVKAEGPPLRLLRLKTWSTPAPAGFLSRFHQLQVRLDEWTSEGVVPLLAASVDASGCPSVLSQRSDRRVPLLDLVRSGRLDPVEAIACLTRLREFEQCARPSPYPRLHRARQRDRSAGFCVGVPGGFWPRSAIALRSGNDMQAAPLPTSSALRRWREWCGERRDVGCNLRPVFLKYPTHERGWITSLRDIRTS